MPKTLAEVMSEGPLTKSERLRGMATEDARKVAEEKISEFRTYVDGLIQGLGDDIEELRVQTEEDLKQLKNDTKLESKTSISEAQKAVRSMEQQVNELVAQAKSEIQTIYNSVDQEVKRITAKVSTLKGPKGDPGKDAIGIQGPAGKDGSPDTGKEIVSKINGLALTPDLQIDYKHIKNVPQKISLGGKRLGRGTGTQVAAYSISSLLNGSTKVFTIPSNAGVILITSSSAPFTFEPTTDYTVSGTTLTFTSNVDETLMLAQGQTIQVLYAEN